MHTFIVLWLGQMVSSIGSSMTYFALTLWVWQRTESVTAIALITFFFQLPQIGMALFSGILVDRLPRKLLLVVSDTVAAGCTLSVGILAATQQLQLWNLYGIAAIYGCFGHIQTLTYSTTVPLIVPEQHYTRANGLGSLVVYSAAIVAPALAGTIYPAMGLLGITLIDLVTFAIALSTLISVPIPRTHRDTTETAEPKNRGIWQEVTFGFRYIGSSPGLLAMMIALSAFAFMNQLADVLYEPLILARTNSNAQILGMVVAASGIGGVTGSLILSIWGGFRRQVQGMLLGFVGTGLSGIVFGMGSLPVVWSVAQFGSSFHSPLVFSSYMAVWYAKVAPPLQGRVFAADHLVGLVIGAIASLVAGPLVDLGFEPLMHGKLGATLFNAIAETERGSGIALLYVTISISMVLLGLGSFASSSLRHAEKRMPDGEEHS